LNIPLIFIGFGVLLFLIGLSNYRKSKQKQNKTLDLD
jgi:hypothetical protein